MLMGCAPPDEHFPDWGARALELEIGPGRGAFALDHAALHPERTLVAIETRRADCELIRHRAARRGLANLEVLQGDAKLLLPRLFRPASLSAIHIQFPDPWWKTRHHKRRMVDVELALLFRRLLAPHALVDFRTDVPAYFREAVQTWLGAGFVQLPDAPPEVLSTRERRYAITGQPVFRAAFENPPGAPPPPPEGRTGRDWRDIRRK
jgi:tRNA (guanine-N7-)-methyltransferase